MSKFTQAKPAFSVFVTGNIDVYEEGQELTKHMDIADYFRQICANGDVTLTLDDNQIVSIAQSIPKTDPEDATDTLSNEDWEIEVCATLESRNNSNSDRSAPLADTRPITDVRASSGSIAGLVAEKFDANETFKQRLHDAAFAPEKVKAGPLNLLLSNLDVYGHSIDHHGLVTDFEKSAFFNEIPHPESEPDEAYLKANGNKVKKSDENKFARYKKVVSGDEITYDWFAEWLDRTTLGKDFIAEIREVKAAMPAKNSDTKPSGKYKDKSTTWKENRLRLWKGRQDSAIKFLKMAALAAYQWRDIVIALQGKVGVNFVMDDPGTGKAAISEGFSTIQIYDKTAPVGAMYASAYSISGFNNLDVQKAIDDGETYVALRDSTKRGPKTPESNTVAWDMEVFQDNRSALKTLLTPAFVSELIKSANERDKATKQRTAHAEDVILDVCDIVMALANFQRQFGGEVYQKISAKRHAEANDVAEQAVA